MFKERDITQTGYLRRNYIPGVWTNTFDGKFTSIGARTGRPVIERA